MKDERRHYIKGFFIVIALVFLIKLFSIQVLSPNYADAAARNTIKEEVEYPYRGLITDRNGQLIVYNTPVFDIKIVVDEFFLQDTATFCNLFGIKKSYLKEVIAKSIKEKHTYKPFPFLKQIPNQEFAAIQDELINYSGLNIVPRTVRSYPHQALANVLGCIAEIDRQELTKANDTSEYYRQGDYVGKTGLEYDYEPLLRGKRGVKYKWVNRLGIEKGKYRGGDSDTASVPGENLVSTIDIDLQKYVERLLDGKVGGVVAIEPSTGEILAMASAPSYDPNILTGRDYGENYTMLIQDSLKPLFNRPLMAQYPPGSMFKTLQALVALQEGVITANERIYVDGSLVGDHAPPGYYNVIKGIQKSSNNYFYKVFGRILNKSNTGNYFEDASIGLKRWREYVTSFGLGSPLGIDIPSSKGGKVPTVEYYDNIYGKRRWALSTIYSLSIGQGELLVTPIQMANLAAIIGNKGYYYTPHLIKEIGDTGLPLTRYQEKNIVPVDSVHFNTVIEAMAAVVESGTGQYRAKLKDIQVCGKTSTVENPHGEDHSGFIAFAPKNNPKIAVAAYVENAGQGARAAASIASLTIEKYLIGQTERPWIEDYVLKGDFIY
jgi:penicillin-binding protein 2